ncbi:MAG: hypothetical protein ABIG93_04315 [archaeon]|nr:hypothetical protein [Nanoarchaeota archaeon]
MVNVVLYLNFGSLKSSQLNLFQDPFSECSFDKKSGLYLIGDGCAPLQVRFIGSHPIGSEERLSQSRDYMFEFDVYASPETLDLPVIRRDKGVLHRRFGSSNRAELSSSARMFGMSLCQSIFLPYRIERDLENALFPDENQRRNLGRVVISEYRSCRSENSEHLNAILEDYKSEKKGDVIPLRPAV